MSATQLTADGSSNSGARRFEQTGYLPLRKLLPRPILDYLTVYFHLLMTNGKLYRDTQAPLSFSIGGDPALDAILDFVGPKVGRRVGRDLVPTLSYARLYMKGDSLAPHTDRNECEISVSVCVAMPPGAGPSRLHFRRPGRRTSQVSMREGDACAYLGTEVEHWRDPFPEGGHVQLFLHYIDRAGPHFPTLRFDGRERLGASYKVQAVETENPDQAEKDNGRVAVTLLLLGGHERTVRLDATDPALTCLLEAIARRGEDKIASRLFNLEFDDGEGSLVFCAADLVALTSDPPLAIDVRAPADVLGFRSEQGGG